MGEAWPAIILAALLCGCPAPGDSGEPEVWSYPLDDTLRVHHLQVKGTHNSYHQQPEHEVIDEWNYSHAPLQEQLSCQGVRQFELDFYWDGGVVFEVYHLPALDDVSSCETLRDCLGELRAWSEKSPAHHPLFVMLEPKDEAGHDPEAYLEALEAAVADAWPDRVLTPDMVRGDHEDLPSALAAEGWPTLGEVRGHLLPWLLTYGEPKDLYTHGGEDLDGRLLFVRSEPGDPYGAVVNRDGPEGSEEDIQAMIGAGYLVRTRADAGGVSDQDDAAPRREAAIESGATMITTDYPAQVEEHDYWLQLPDGTPSRCNPVNTPAVCFSEALEDPAFIDRSPCAPWN